jgi:ketosteroid isomerase-like protein
MPPQAIAQMNSLFEALRFVYWALTLFTACLLATYLSVCLLVLARRHSGKNAQRTASIGARTLRNLNHRPQLKEGTTAMKMILKLTIVFALLCCLAPMVAAQKKPNLSGVWRKTFGQELLTIEHSDPKIHLVYWIKDISGERTLDLTAMTDGKKHKQTVMGGPATVVMRWDGAGLDWEFWRESGAVKVHNRRTFMLSADGQALTAERLDFPANGTEGRRSTETWTKVSQAEQEVVKLHQDFLAAVMSGNAEAVKRFLADDYVGINVTGAMDNKAQAIANTKPAPASAPKVEAKPYGETKTRFYGDTAVTTGGLTFSSTAINHNWRYTSVAVKRQGQWQFASIQSTIVGQPAASASSSRGDDAAQNDQELQQLGNEMVAAFERNDAAALDRIFADDFMGTNDQGQLYDKAALLGLIKSGAFKYESVKVDDLKLQIFGNSAVANGRVSVKLQANGKPQENVNRNTVMWAKRQGQWRIVAVQGTPLAK